MYCDHNKNITTPIMRRFFNLKLIKNYLIIVEYYSTLTD